MKSCVSKQFSPKILNFLENIPKMIQAGATNLVGGSSGLFIKGKPLAENIALFRQTIQEGTE